MQHALTTELWEQLEEVAGDAGLDEGALRDRYSGRAMYGDTCLALVGSVGDLVRFLLELSHAASRYDPDPDAEAAQLRLRELVDTLRGTGTRHDGMGRDTVYYWPVVSAD
jgi:hypothetical protein